MMWGSFSFIGISLIFFVDLLFYPYEIMIS